ncbi:ABC-2 type transport system ATP-binding protein [Lachnotalea glycerini]|uniref:ABC-2 type transport system ATP-binding protein n=1 Tax=Lachnotalea glycerini TaxID=1763509 RepID=A0A318ETM9_9FIRM|nr:ABC transporter ATP-binding protein [Lachnotalea glycerini]PXV91608.1 ABC-2 type transport system ATP-binding protein [Lachnotalea glycerini]
MEEILKVKQLSKSYHGNRAVTNLNLSVKKGMVLGLLGANGAGKSTSIECILGTKKPDSGFVTVLGKNPISDRKQLFQNVGVQFQEANYQREIKVDELCDETSAIYKNPKDWHNLLKQFGIIEKERCAVKDLSGGERQRLFIILALIPNPQIVFLDELTTGLDAKARKEVWKTLDNLKKNGLTIILTSHFMDEVEVLCDIICILKKGETVFYGTVNEAIAKSPYDKFEDAYLWFSDEEGRQDENI